MALTKNDLKQIRLEITTALQKQKGEIVVELSEFLEKYVMEPIFGLKKDVAVLKKDVAVLKKDVAVLKKDVREIKHTVEQTNKRIDAVLERGDRQDEQIEDHEKRISRLEPQAVMEV